MLHLNQITKSGIQMASSGAEATAVAYAEVVLEQAAREQLLALSVAEAKLAALAEVEQGQHQTWKLEKQLEQAALAEVEVE